jgi:hypothetical protein
MRGRPLPRFAAVGLALASIAVVGCGALPPQAPLAYAKKLDSATSGISTVCGSAYQVTAFPGNHTSDLDGLEASAAAYSRKLEKVFRRNREWVYQGDTVAEISSDAVSMLESCGLHRAANQLKRATTASS